MSQRPSNKADSVTSATRHNARPTPPVTVLETVKQGLSALQSLARFYTDHHGADNEERYTVFHSAVEPGISLPDYALRMNRHLDAGDDAVLLSLILVGRYSQRTGFLPSVLTVHRLFLASLRVVTKAQHDVTRSTASYARAGGIHVAELCRLERHLLDGVAFSVFFRSSEVEFFRYHLAMAEEHRDQPDEALNFAAVAMHLVTPSLRPSDPFQPASPHFALPPQLHLAGGAGVVDAETHLVPSHCGESSALAASSSCIVPPLDAALLHSAPTSNSAAAAAVPRDALVLVSEATLQHHVCHAPVDAVDSGSPSSLYEAVAPAAPTGGNGCVAARALRLSRGAAPPAVGRSPLHSSLPALE